MKRRVLWLLVSCLMVVALILTSCGPAVTEEEEEEEVVTEEEEEVVGEEEEEEEEEEGPEMVRDSVGNLVEKPQYGGVFTLARSTDVLYFDEIGRFIHYSQSQHLTNDALFNGDWAKGPTGSGEASWMYHLFPKMDLAAGAVAESFEMPDSTTIILHIRQGMNFHDKPPTNGRELTADDVVYSLWRIWHEESSYNTLAYPYDTHFESMEATDKYTVVIKTKDSAKTAGIFDMLMMHHKIVPKDAVELYGDLYDWENANGTGPFLLVDYVPVSSLVFERNPNFWGNDPLHPDNRLPYLDGVKWLIIPDMSTRIAALRTHKIDWLQLGWEDAESVLTTSPELEYVEWLTGSSAGIWFRMDKPEIPMYDKKVRHALNIAVNNQEILDSYYGGYGEVLTYPVAPIAEDIDMYTPLEELPESTQELFGYNPDKAKQLLTEAGYPDGFKTSVLLTPTVVDLMSIVAAYWADIGVDLELIVRETAAFNGLLYSKGYEHMVYAAASSPNPFRFFYEIPGSYINFSAVDDPVMNDIYAQLGPARFDDTLRRQLVTDSVPHRLDLAYYLQLPGTVTFTFWTPWVKGYSGENCVGYAHWYFFPRHIWIDQDLREEMTGQR